MGTNGAPVVQAIGLTKHFRDFWYRKRVVAVDHLDLDIHRNEVFGLLGPNGSGKTTTIKMLLGLLYPTRGRINVLGYPPTDVAIKARIGFLPEESYLYRFLNARETLDYYGRLFCIPRQDRLRRVEQLLEMVGLTRQARRRVGEYSKGMARRIGLAQALINDPDLLILDEPTTGLDPIGTREIKDLIIRLREKGKTILLCSHLLADVEDVCQRVVVLYGGRRCAVGTIQELLSHQDLTQITTEKLTDEMIARIRHLVETEAGKSVMSVSTPSDRLESFFLRIVREAQQAQHQTSGVVTGGRIAEFLASPVAEGQAVVESLVAAGYQPVQASVGPAGEAPAPVLAGGEKESSELIEGLLSVSAATVAPAESVPLASATPAPAAVVAEDQGVVESLLHRTGGQPSRPEAPGGQTPKE